MAMQPPLSIVPALREDLDLHEAACDRNGRPTWVIEDPARNRFFQIDHLTFEVVSRWHLATPEAIVAAVNHETPFEVSDDYIQMVVTFLKQQHLLHVSRSADLPGAKRSSQHWAMWLVHHYLFFRIPLVRPDRFLDKTQHWVEPLFSKAALYVLLSALALGLFLLSRQWDVFQASFVDMFNLQGMLYFFIALGISKVGHELGHAFAAKRQGCRVPSMGVAFLVLWPMLYTDTNDTWKIKSRAGRLSVGAAGMTVELAFAAVATLLWAVLPDGAMRDMALVWATTTWISSLLINISPFMRFDGYYLLSDMLGLPNLHARAFALSRWRLREWLFDLKRPVPEHFSSGMHWFLIIFGYGVWIYRLLLFIGIAVLVYSFFIKVVGIILFVVEVLWFILKPFMNELRVWFRIRDDIQKTRRSKLTACVVVGGMIFCVAPLPSTVIAPGLMQSSSHVTIYANHPGILMTMLPAHGAELQKMDVIARLENPDLAAERHIADINQLRLKYEMTLASVSVEHRLQSDSVIAEMAKNAAERRILSEQVADLTLRTPFSGVWVDPEPDLSTGQWVGQGQRLGAVVRPGQYTVDAFVTEDDIHLITKDATCLFYARSDPRLKWECHIQDMERLPSQILTRPELSSLNAGTITVQHTEGGLVPEQNIYRMSLKVHAENISDMPSQSVAGVARLSAATESYVMRVYRWVMHIMIKESAW